MDNVIIAILWAALTAVGLAIWIETYRERRLRAKTIWDLRVKWGLDEQDTPNNRKGNTNA